MSFLAAHSQVVRCEYRGLEKEDYSFCSNHPSVGEPCEGSYLSVDRVSPRRSAEQRCRTESLHRACACTFIQLDSILNASEQCMGFMRRKCCMLGFANTLLKPSYDAWLDIQEALNHLCKDCPQQKKMRYCNSLCCTGFSSSCYKAALSVLEDYPLDKSVINTKEKADALFCLLKEPISACLNRFGYAGTW